MTAKKLLTKRSEKNKGLFELRFEHGGELPRALSGYYTSENAALSAANSYIEARDNGTGKGK